MDIIIHLIIWLFKALFGEQEPPAKVGPGYRERNSEPRRGPYDYGDGRPPQPGARPKTLAELLEEAREKSGAGGAGRGPVQGRTEVMPVGPAPRTSAPAQAPRRAEPQNAAPRAVPIGDPYVSPMEAEEKLRKKAQQRKRKKAAAAERRAQEQAQAAPESLFVAQPESHGFRDAEHQMHGFRKEDHGMQGFDRAGVQEQPHEVTENLEEWLGELRDTKGKEKALAGARAIIALEIFGPPRCRRPLQPGRHPRVQ